MSTEKTLAGAIGRQEWLGRVADLVAPLIQKGFKAAGDRRHALKNALNGVWLGHPLHPVLTDVPIGAWTVALVFDLLDATTSGDGYARAADGAVITGLAGAVGAAVTGLTDWSDTDGEAKRIGLTHGLMNTTAASLYLASAIARRRGVRGRGRAYAACGYAIACGAAYLGGHLVYREQIGVNHAAGQTVPEEFTAVLPENELKDSTPTRVRVGTTRVLLVRQGGRVFALAETCSHLGGPLSEGELEEGTIECPWHDSKFALEDGHVINGPATHPVPCFEARVHNGQIEVRMPRPPRPESEAGASSPGARWRSAS